MPPHWTSPLTLKQKILRVFSHSNREGNSYKGKEQRKGEIWVTEDSIQQHGSLKGPLESRITYQLLGDTDPAEQEYGILTWKGIDSCVILV